MFSVEYALKPFSHTLLPHIYFVCWYVWFTSLGEAPKTTSVVWCGRLVCVRILSKPSFFMAQILKKNHEEQAWWFTTIKLVNDSPVTYSYSINCLDFFPLSHASNFVSKLLKMRCPSDVLISNLVHPGHSQRSSFTASFLPPPAWLQSDRLILAAIFLS